MSNRVDCVVIGAGVIGLAIGRDLAQSGREVIIVERNANFGEETSSRNSEVIHAGLYYPTDSLKATLCVQGRNRLYAYCKDRKIAAKRCGKLIVATDQGQLARLDEIAAQARKNGVHDLIELNSADIAAREPAVRAVAGLWSPSTGIFDSHAFMLGLLGDFEAADGLLARQSTVQAIDVQADHVRLLLDSGDDSTELIAQTVVNAAGLDACRLARSATGTAPYRAPDMLLAKGNYFTYSGSSPFQSLVYPLPTDGGLGIHATLDLAGGLRFGPDVEWIDAIDYRVDPARRAAFSESIRHYWPEIEEDALTPSYAGIRPKLSAADKAWTDFRIDVAAAGSKRQLVHLLGIESPGLTSALPLAALTCDRIRAAAG